MEEKYYFRVDDGEIFFAVEGTHEILPEDKEISKEDHTKFLELQSQGQRFRAKAESTGVELFDYIEEYIPEPIEVKLELDAEDYLLDLEYRVSLIELGGIENDL